MAVQYLICSKCGVVWHRKRRHGPKPIYCTRCSKNYRVSDENRRKPPRQFVCEDCGGSFKAKHQKGPPTKRCPSCKAENKARLQRRRRKEESEFQPERPKIKAVSPAPISIRRTKRAVVRSFRPLPQVETKDRVNSPEVNRQTVARFSIADKISDTKKSAI